jgi:hypothetical protein
MPIATGNGRAVILITGFRRLDVSKACTLKNIQDHMEQFYQIVI